MAAAAGAALHCPAPPPGSIRRHGAAGQRYARGAVRTRAGRRRSARREPLVLMPNPVLPDIRGCGAAGRGGAVLAEHHAANGYRAGPGSGAGGGAGTVVRCCSYAVPAIRPARCCRWTTCARPWSWPSAMTSSSPPMSVNAISTSKRPAPAPSLLQAAALAGDHAFQRCLVFHSLSKRSSVPGLRSGFVAGDAS